MRYLLFILFLMAHVSIVNAKSIEFGFLEIDVDKENGTIKTVFDFNPTVLGNPALPFHQTIGKTFWKSGSTKCTWRNTSAEILSDEQAIVTGIAVCPEIKSDLSLDLAFMQRAPVGYKILGRINNDGIESTFISTRIQKDIRINPTVDQTFSHYVTMGMAHIGAAPSEWISAKGLKLPMGFDHVLFILALILTGGTLIQTFKAVTGFTIGHTITLLLGILGPFALPGHFIEAAISLSIIYVAVEGIIKKRPEHRFLIGLVLGLVHGLGFASAIPMLNLSRGTMTEALMGLNVGVEIGQVIIVLMILPLLLLMRRYSNYHQQFIRSSAFGVLILVCYLFVERTFL